MAYTEIVDGPLDLERVVARVAAPEYGAVATFLGQVRDNSRGERVRYLRYDAYRALADKELASVAAEAEERWEVRCAVEHRLGRVDVGVASVIIAVASPHRADAFEAAQWLMDAIKQRVPIWKKEYYQSGARWVEGSNIVESLPE